MVYFRFNLIVSLLFFSWIVSGQIIEPTSAKVNSFNNEVNKNGTKWALGAVASFKPVKSVLIYDLGVQASRSVTIGQRIRIEAGYRSTAGSDLVVKWGGVPLNIKTDVSSLVFGACYDWFPFVTSGNHGQFLKAAKIFAGISYFSKPEYAFEAGLRNPYVFKDTAYTPEEVGVVLTTIKTNKIQPYLGIGYDQFYLVKNINFSFNAGVMYHGKPQVNMVATKMLKPTEENAGKFEKNLESYQFMPLLQVLIQFNLI